MNTETWLPVVDFEDSHSVSSLGRVRGEQRVTHYADGRTRITPQRVLKSSANGKGYLVVSLCVDGTEKLVYVHQLVAQAFLGPRPAGMEVRHLDDRKINCQASNLAYGDRSANQQDAVRNGRHHLARRDRCKHQHLYSPDNVARYPSKPTVRICLTCQRNNRPNRQRAAA